MSLINENRQFSLWVDLELAVYWILYLRDINQ